MIDLSRLFSKTMKKICSSDFSQSVFLNIQYLPPKTLPSRSAIASSRKYCRAFIEYRYFDKNDVPVSPEFSRSIFLTFSLFLSLLLSLLLSLSPAFVFLSPWFTSEGSSPKSFLVFSHSRAGRKLEKFATGQ